MDKTQAIIYALITSVIRQGVLTIEPFVYERLHYDLNHPSTGIYISFIASFIAMGVWSYVEKSKYRKLFEAALALPAGSTPEDAENKVLNDKILGQTAK